MRLSPFDRLSKDSWLREAPLYGRPGPRDPQGRCTFEVFPVSSDEDVSNWSRISRDKDECNWNVIGFDIPVANDGTDYVLMVTTSDGPRLQWYSRSKFKDWFLYDPLDPPRPQGVDPNRWEEHAENRVQGQTESTVGLTSDREALLKRIARLWNGEEVCDVHLLADQCPTISDLTTDLDENPLIGSCVTLYRRARSDWESQILSHRYSGAMPKILTHDPMKRLYYNTDLGRETLLAFGDADWFEGTTGFLKSTAVFRKQAWYDLTQKGRTLINGHEDFPDLHGDPNEGLVHRITVGLVCLRDQIRGWNSYPYQEWEGYTIDAAANDQQGRPYAREILTEHHNWRLYRKTYRKMQKLDQHGIKPIAVFDGRDTAYHSYSV